MIDGLQTYRDRIKQIPEALKLKGEGIRKAQIKNPIQYIH